MVYISDSKLHQRTVRRYAYDSLVIPDHPQISEKCTNKMWCYLISRSRKRARCLNPAYQGISITTVRWWLYPRHVKYRIYWFTQRLVSTGNTVIYCDTHNIQARSENCWRTRGGLKWCVLFVAEVPSSKLESTDAVTLSHVLHMNSSSVVIHEDRSRCLV
jgi:hypothetical protein